MFVGSAAEREAKVSAAEREGSAAEREGSARLSAREREGARLRGVRLSAAEREGSAR